VQEGDGDHRVALDEVDHQTLLVEVSVQVLAQAVDPLVVVCLEALFDAVGAVGEWCVGARLRARLVGAFVGEQLAARGGVQEAQRAVLVGRHGETAVEEAGAAVRGRGHGGGRGGDGNVQGPGEPGALPVKVTGAPRAPAVQVRDRHAIRIATGADTRAEFTDVLRPGLYRWRPTGLAVGHRPHEGPNVFELGGCYWMLVDEWRGQGVLRSDDLTTWEHRGLILDRPGGRLGDGTVGLHADVVVQGGTAYVFYFTHPGRVAPATGDDGTYATRRSSLQVAAARVVDGSLCCDRDEPVRLDLSGAT
jgi:hypothetical protein